MFAIAAMGGRFTPSEPERFADHSADIRAAIAPAGERGAFYVERTTIDGWRLSRHDSDGHGDSYTGEEFASGQEFGHALRAMEFAARFAKGEHK